MEQPGVLGGVKAALAFSTAWASPYTCASPSPYFSGQVQGRQKLEEERIKITSRSSCCAGVLRMPPRPSSSLAGKTESRFGGLCESIHPSAHQLCTQPRHTMPLLTVNKFSNG